MNSPPYVSIAPGSAINDRTQTTIQPAQYFGINYQSDAGPQMIKNIIGIRKGFDWRAPAFSKPFPESGETIPPMRRIAGLQEQTTYVGL